jgi:hypothetical protein
MINLRQIILNMKSLRPPLDLEAETRILWSMVSVTSGRPSIVHLFLTGAIAGDRQHTTPTQTKAADRLDRLLGVFVPNCTQKLARKYP